jgi:hypothetical protein
MAVTAPLYREVNEMKWLVALLPPSIILFIIVLIISRLWQRLDRVDKVGGDSSTTELTERIYKNFEFFVKIYLALVGGFGYVKFTYGLSAQAGA